MLKDRDKITGFTVNIGLYTNIFLSVLKTLIGIMGHSSALLADGINSTSDVVYYIAVKIFMRQANKPADSEHPYGHRQLESISAIVVGAFIITTGVAIFWQAINTIYDTYLGNLSEKSVSYYALMMAAFTFFLKIWLYYTTKKNYHLTDNPTLRALANDHLNDIFASFAVVVGIIFNKLGYIWMDPLAGAVVALFILRTGVGIVIESSHELMDTFPDKSFKENVRLTALKVEGVQTVCDIGVNRFGPYFNVNMTIGVDGQITVRQADLIADEVETALKKTFSHSLRNVIIHFHPDELCGISSSDPV